MYRAVGSRAIKVDFLLRRGERCVAIDVKQSSSAEPVEIDPAEPLEEPVRLLDMNPSGCP